MSDGETPSGWTPGGGWTIAQDADGPPILRVEIPAGEVLARLEVRGRELVRFSHNGDIYLDGVKVIDGDVEAAQAARAWVHKMRKAKAG